MGISMMAGFMIIPNIAAHLQMNMGYPRAHLGVLYLCGGGISFFTMRAAGWLVDKTSSTHSVILFTITLISALALGFVWFPTPIPVVVVFMLFMVSMSGRNVSAQTLASKIPTPAERGAFMSLQSSVIHMASALGAYYSSLVLVESEGKLLHVPVIGMSAIVLSLFVPLLVWYVERSRKISIG
jgi:predicted MFS family arabinose efflux permease